MTSPTESALATPSWLLARVDAATSSDARFHFAEVSRETYFQSAFLDHRISPMPSNLGSTDVAEAQKVAGSIPPAPVGWILHTAFCCSTLLARSIDRPGRTLVLREPLALTTLANRRRENPRRGDPLIATGLRLMERSWSPEVAVIKPSNYANGLLPDLEAGAHRRFVFLTSGLRAFLVSLLKKVDEAERQLPVFVQAFLRDSDYAERAGHGLLDDMGADVLRWGAVMWHCQRYALGLRLESLADRCLPLTMNALLADPLGTLAKVNAHFSLGMTESEVSDAASGDAFRHHAKSGGDAFDTQRKQAEDAAIQESRGEQIDAAIAWLKPTLQRLPVVAFAGENDPVED